MEAARCRLGGGESGKMEGEGAGAEGGAEVAQRVRYDLVSTISPYLDLHMMFPLIQFMQGKGVYKEKDLTLVLLDFLRATNMVDYAIEILGSLGPIEAGEEAAMNERREQAVRSLEELEAVCQPLLDVLRNEEELAQLNADGNFTAAHLAEAHGISEDMFDSFYRYGKFNYELGQYQDTIYIMHYYRELLPAGANAWMALWGKLASELLIVKTTDHVVAAHKDLMLLQKQLDERDTNPVGATHHLEMLQFRSWLLHWSLFLWFKQTVEEPGPDSDGTAAGAPEYPKAPGMNMYLLQQMVEMFFSRTNMDTIQMNCPWLLRYCVVAVVILQRGPRRFRNKLIQVVQQEGYQYRDPLTRFIESLYIDFDFDVAQTTLRECEQVMKDDFFLEHLAADFKEAGRLALFDSFCRIHTKIDTTMLSSKVDIAGDVQGGDAEEWLVNLIQSAKLDAKIDSRQNCIVMAQQVPEVYQQLIDKTKDLAYRTYAQCGALIQQQAQQDDGSAAAQ